MSGVGGGIPKNIGEGNNMKRIRVHIKGHGSYCNLPENPEGSEGLRGRSLRERAGAEAEGGQRALGTERSGGWRSRVGEDNTRDWGGHR